MNGQTKNKRILVVTSRLPFVAGGNTVLAEAIVSNLKKMGYSSDLWFTPQNRFGRQVAAYLANRLTDLGMTGMDEKIDGIISMRFPSFAVKHPHHVCWLNHCMREYYDLWPAHRGKLTTQFAVLKENTRKLIFHQIDKYLLNRNVTKLYAQSQNIANRLKTDFGIQSEVLYPPPRTDLSYRHGDYGNYILSVSRLNKRKRHDVFIKSFSFLKETKLKGIIAGDGEESDALKKLIEQENLGGQVRLTGEVTAEELSRLYSDALAVYFAPMDEDYGNVTLEAFRFGKAVITAHDSGGPLEFVKNGETGFITDPEPGAISEIFLKLFQDKQKARAMGKRAFEFASGFTWENTIPKLVPDAN
jgi:glycosyltransferase involved in cell wall biosynthesis